MQVRVCEHSLYEDQDTPVATRNSRSSASPIELINGFRRQRTWQGCPITEDDKVGILEHCIERNPIARAIRKSIRQTLDDGRNLRCADLGSGSQISEFQMVDPSLATWIG